MSPVRNKAGGSGVIPVMHFAGLLAHSEQSAEVSSSVCQLDARCTQVQVSDPDQGPTSVALSQVAGCPPGSLAREAQPWLGWARCLAASGNLLS